MTPVPHGLTADGWETVVYAKDQPEYSPLLVLRSPDGVCISAWRLSWRERLQLLLGGRMFLTLLTFNKPLTPCFLQVGPVRFTETVR